MDFLYSENLSVWFEKFLIDLGVSEFLATVLNIIALLIVYVAFLLIIGYLLIRVFRSFLKIISKSNKVNFQKYLNDTGFARYLVYLVLLMGVSNFTSILFIAHPEISKILVVLINSTIIILAILFVGSILKGIENYLTSIPHLKEKPLQSYRQVIIIFVWCIGLMALINYIAGGNLITFAGLGAASAVILLVFRDTILGFVASIQISVNDIVRIGDWIEFPKYGADGFVINISLVTVTIENWDKTYSTVPTYSLIADSFKNWRGIYDNQARLIKRAIYIKQSIIRFVKEEDLERFRKIERVKNYIDHRQLDIDRFNQSIEADKSIIVNGRNQTNIGIFKKYIETYLKEQTSLNFDFLCLVRNLAPTEYGVPLEVYCFSKRTPFVEYEAIQGMIMDHITAAASYFDLEIFELPSGKDLKNLNENSSNN